MKPTDMARALTVAGALVLALFWRLQTLEGQVPVQPDPLSIQSLTEPGERLAVKAVSTRTGRPIFASSPGRGILLPLDPSASAEARALSFVDTYGAPFGLADSSQVRMLAPPDVDALGVEHVRLQQVHRGVPVRAGEFLVHLQGSRAVAANGHVADDLPDSVIPAVPAGVAQQQAQQLLEKRRPDQAAGARYSEPRLEIFNRSLLSAVVDFRSRLAWFVEATGPGLREYIWIDAQTGVVLLNFNQIVYAKSRRVYNANHTDTLPGTLVRSEGEPATGDADQDNAYSYAGLTYDYYLTSHGRDSFDNAGGLIISTAHFCPPGSCPAYPNAFWNGTQMVYGDGYASADDVVGHELTHAVTERSANLLYYVQSGALNESFSDIFGETVDLIDGVGNDAANVRWRMGEDLPIGAIRDMMNPTAFGDPGKMSDDEFKCNSNAWTDPSGDSGGVHSNSGIPNHAYALMVDGGSYNGRTVTGIGLTKAAKVQYRALTVYLTSGSGFLDDYHALNQSCSDLIGTSGITTSDCAQVDNALLAVEMNSTWACSGATQTPPLCSTGAAAFSARDTFESGIGNWTPTNTSNGEWLRDTGFASGGTFMLYGTDQNGLSDHRISMTSAVTIPAGGRLHFDHAFEFENDFFAVFDGGVIEYSTNGGASWTDAGSLIDAGQAYNGTLESGGGNVLEGRSAFSGSSYGYTGTRLNLASLAGQSVTFRFRIGSDVSIASLGWTIDNVAIYSCAAAGPPVITSQPLSQTIGFGQTASLNVVATGPSLTYQWYLGTSGMTTSPIGGAAASSYTTPALTGTRRFWVRVSNVSGSVDSSTATITVTFTDTPLTANTSLIRLVHINELRIRIDALRIARGLPAYAWTDPVLIAGTTPIRAVHITDLRTAVAQAYAAAGQTTPAFTDPVLTPAVTPARIVHIAELRSAVIALE